MSEHGRWEVILTRQPQRILRRLPGDLRRRIDERLCALADDPRPEGCKHLRAFDLYRLRVGDWRIIYSIVQERLVVLVVRIAPRGGAYNDL